MVSVDDIRLAEGLSFYISIKDPDEGAWIRVASGRELTSAYRCAINPFFRWESAIFVETSSGGLLYWSSRDPDIFNSTVLDLAKKVFG